MSQHESPRAPKETSYKSTLIGVALVFVVYFGLLCAGLPQGWTAASHTSHEEHGDAIAETVEDGGVENVETFENVVENATDSATENATENVAENAENAENVDGVVVSADEASEGATESEAAQIPPLWTIAPFAILLLCIAILPLIPATEHWWESNLNRFLVAAVLGAITLAYYAFVCDFPIALHWPAHKVVDPSAGATAMGATVFVNAILGEYVSFIVLLFALFTIAGGIRISGDLKATPATNAAILAIGALMASFVGTTGAAMLLIRLLLETNKERKYKVHTVVFFIFCVCNVGGCLLPIGDPPLFLGYLRGVAFLWTFHLWKEWLFVCGLLVGLYYLADKFYFYRKETPLDKAVDSTERRALRVRGLCPNLFCLIGVVLAVMLLDPAQEFLSLFGVKTGWYPPMFLREIVQLAMVAISLLAGSNAIRKENDFNFGAIIEVAALFFGIFICMQAPLQILNEKGAVVASSVDKYASKINLDEPRQFFWMSGALSSVLDNAPTYVVFFETAKSAAEGELKVARDSGEIETAERIEAELNEGKAKSGVRIPLEFLIAVSLGSVFMGAMTYIGNGPNFMVKAIAEQSGVKMPSFFGYMGYSLCILLPILIMMTLIFM